MATKLWLLDAASDINPGTEIEKRADFVSNNAAASKATSAPSGTVVVQATDTAGGAALSWLTPPLAAVTIAGAIAPNLWAFESASNVNAKRRILIERTTTAGVVNGTVVPATTHGAEIGTTNAANAAWSITPTSTTLLDGERLKITLFVDLTSAAAGTVTYSVNAQKGAAGDSWIEFTETLRRQQGTAAATLTDNFNAASIDTTKWAVGGDTGSTQAQSGGAASVTAPSGSGSSFFQSVARYDLWNSAIFAQVVPGSGVESSLRFDLGGANNRYEIYPNGGTLVMRSVVSDTVADTTLPYDATAHAWLRLRHVAADDTIRWDTSPDSSTWTERRSLARTGGIGNGAILLHAQNTSGATANLTATFDDLNGGSVGVVHLAAATITSSVALSPGATLAAAGSAPLAASATVAGDGGLALLGATVATTGVTVAASGSVAVGAAAAVAASVVVQPVALLSLGAVVAVTAAAVVAAPGRLALPGVAFLAASAMVAGDGGLPLLGVATLAGSATVAGDGGLSLPGVASLAASATVAGQGTAALAGGLRPAIIPARSAGLTLTVSGSRFAPTDTVRLDGQSRTTTYVDATTLTAVLLPPDLAAAQDRAVTVATAAGAVSAPLTLTITRLDPGLPPAPAWGPLAAWPLLTEPDELPLTTEAGDPLTTE